MEILKDLIEELKILQHLFASDRDKNNVYLRVGVNTTLDLLRDKVERLPQKDKEELLQILNKE